MFNWRLLNHRQVFSFLVSDSITAAHANGADMLLGSVLYNAIRSQFSVLVIVLLY